MPTGWRPADVAVHFPDKKIENPYNFEKYAPKSSQNLLIWIWFQFLFTFILLFHLFGNIAKIGMPNFFIYGGFIYLLVFSYTELMDRNRFAILWEIIKNILGFALIYSMGDWFGNSQLYTWATSAMMIYFVLSTIITAYFVWFEIRKDKPVVEMKY